MNKKTISCPNPDCGFPLPPDAKFCSECGTDIGGNPTEEKTEKDRPTSRAAATEIPPLEFKPSAERLTGQSSCLDLDVLYNVSQVFLEEVSFPFEFKFIPREDGITDVCIELEARGISGLIYRAPEKEFISGEEYSAEVEFRPPPGKHGIIPFTIFFGYQKNNQDRWYVAHHRHRIYRQNEPARKALLETLNVNIDNSIAVDNAGNAVDINVAREQRDNQLGKLLQELGGAPAKNLEDISLPPVYEALPLRECRPRHPVRLIKVQSVLASPPREAITDRLTLKIGPDRLLHLLDIPIIHLGRHRACDIVIRLMDEDVQAIPEKNLRISRFHCHIINEKGECRLVDLGINRRENSQKPSTHGVYLDHSRVPPGGALPLPLNKKFTVALAGDQVSDPTVFGFEGQIATCGAMGECRISLHEQCRPHEPANMILQRSDTIPETFVILWRLLALENLDDEVLRDSGDTYFFRHRGAFAYRRGAVASAQWGWLVPGKKISEFGGEIEVLPYTQFGS